MRKPPSQFDFPAVSASGNRFVLKLIDYLKQLVNSIIDAQNSVGGNAFGTIAVSGQSNVVADQANDTLTLAAGSNITITTTAASDTVTIAASSGGNAFGTIAVSGQSNVVADSANDTLTLAAGTNVTITTDATTDTVTINATAGSTSPGGSDTQIQFNDGGAFGGDADLTWGKTSHLMTLGTAAVPAVITAPTGASAVPLTLRGGPGSSGSVGGYAAILGGTTSGIGSVGGAAKVTAGDGLTGGLVELRSGTGDSGSGSGGAIKVFYGGGLVQDNFYTNGAGTARSTSSTGAFFCIPNCAGVPTGTPALSLTGNTPVIFDTSNNRLYAYDAGWIDIGGGFSDGDKGDITVSASGATFTIDNDVVSYAKMQNVSAASRLLGRGAGSGSGDVQEISLGTNISMSTTTLNVTETFRFIVAVGDETSALTTGTAKVTFRFPVAATLTEVRASLTSAQSSGTILTVDINKNGTTMLSTKLTVDNSEKTSETAATAHVISVSSIADDDEITIDIDAVGTGGTGLKVTFIGTVP